MTPSPLCERPLRARPYALTPHFALPPLPSLGVIMVPYKFVVQVAKLLGICQFEYQFMVCLDICEHNVLIAKFSGNVF